jgi:DNA-binding NarL/FixJ family response regulator
LLIIDHHEAIRQALVQRLSRVSGIRVVGTAGSTQEGIAQAHAQRPDVVLLEPKLPDGQWLHVLRALRVENPAVRIIILTSYRDDFEHQSAMQAGAEHYLLKTIDSESLAQAILEPPA